MDEEEGGICLNALFFNSQAIILSTVYDEEADKYREADKINQWTW